MGGCGVHPGIRVSGPKSGRLRPRPAVGRECFRTRTPPLVVRIDPLQEMFRAVPDVSRETTTARDRLTQNRGRFAGIPTRRGNRSLTLSTFRITW